MDEEREMGGNRGGVVPVIPDPHKFPVRVVNRDGWYLTIVDAAVNSN